MEDSLLQAPDHRRMSRPELTRRLNALQSPPAKKNRISSRDRELQAVLHEVEVYQIELEMQVRELRDSRQALEDSHERYVSLFDFAPVGYVTLDELGLIREINLTAASLLGVERRWLLEKSLAPWIQGCDLPAFRHHLKECRKISGKVITQLSLQGREKQIVPVELSTSCSTDPVSGKALFRMAVSDLSDRRRAEAELDRFFNLSSDLLCLAGTDGYFKRLNASWESALGYTKAELLALPFGNFVHPEDRHATETEFRRLGVTGAFANGFQNRFLRHDGSVVWLSWSSVNSADTIYCVARDISREVQAKQDRENQYEWLQELIRLIPVPLLLMETDSGKAVSMSEVSEKMLGSLSPEASSVEKSSTFLANEKGERLPLAKWPRMRVARGETLESEPHIWCTPAGPAHLLVSSKNIPAKLGQPAMSVIVSHDVTHLKQSQERLKAAVSVAKIGFFDWNISSNQMIHSNQVQADWGIQFTATLEDAFARIHPDDQQKVRLLFREARKNLSPYRAQYRVVRPDGNIVWIEAQGNFNGDRAGLPHRFFGTSLDITERKQAEFRLAFERYKLSTIFRESPAAMALWKGPNFIFEMLNPDFQALFEDRDLIGKPVLEALPDLVGQQFHALLSQVLRTGESFIGREMLVRLARKAGAPAEDRFFDLSLVRVKDRDRVPYGVYCHAMEVTDRVLARQCLEESRRIVQKNVVELEAERELRERFVAALSHDLRTPLTAAKLSAQLLKRMNPDLSQLSIIAGRISGNMDRADQMIHNLLDANRIKAGEMISLKVEKVALHALLHSTLETVRVLHGNPFLVHASEPVEGYWDPQAIVRMIENLVGNGVKYGTKNAPITVSLTTAGESVAISVHNEGNPLSEEDQTRLFQYFYRTDSAQKGNERGWGIGLVLVRGLAEAHGGTIGVSSSPEVGTTFRIELPRDARVVKDCAQANKHSET